MGLFLSTAHSHARTATSPVRIARRGRLNVTATIARDKKKKVLTAERRPASTFKRKG